MKHIIDNHISELDGYNEILKDRRPQRGTDNAVGFNLIIIDGDVVAQSRRAATSIWFSSASAIQDYLRLFALGYRLIDHPARVAGMRHQRLIGLLNQSSCWFFVDQR